VLLDDAEIRARAQMCRLMKRATLMACDALFNDCDELVARRRELVNDMADAWQHAMGALAVETETAAAAIDAVLPVDADVCSLCVRGGWRCQRQWRWRWCGGGVAVTGSPLHD
jgi:hypothetical protein